MNNITYQPLTEFKDECLWSMAFNQDPSQLSFITTNFYVAMKINACKAESDGLGNVFSGIEQYRVLIDPF